MLDPARHEVHRGGNEIRLSPKEFALLEYLMRHEGEVLGRSQILDHVWDFAYDGTSNVVDVYMRYLRAKVDRPFGVETIETVRGVGYRLRQRAERRRRDAAEASAEPRTPSTPALNAPGDRAPAS